MNYLTLNIITKEHIWIRQMYILVRNGISYFQDRLIVA